MDYKKIAQEKLQVTPTDSLNCTENDSTTFVLCQKIIDRTSKQPRNFIQYIIINTKTKEVVYEGPVSGGSVKWYDTNRIEIFQQESL